MTQETTIAQALSQCGQSKEGENEIATNSGAEGALLDEVTSLNPIVVLMFYIHRNESHRRRRKQDNVPSVRSNWKRYMPNLPWKNDG